jgi:hypothetical protein
VLEVVFHYGGESGDLRLRHIGRKGERLVGIHEAYGRMAPIVAYKPYTPEGALPMNAASVSRRQAAGLREQIHSVQERIRRLSFQDGPFAEEKLQREIEVMQDQLRRLEGP